MWILWTIVLIIIAILLFFYSCTGDGWQGLAGQLYAYLVVAITLIVGINMSEPTPTALDVYRGNTELEITSVNGIPTDTTVVFKKK